MLNRISPSRRPWSLLALAPCVFAAMTLLSGCDCPKIPQPDKEPAPAKIDLLFVVDNSGSMESEQEALAASIPGFLEKLQKSLGEEADLQVGVVATGGNRDSFGAPGCEKLGALIQETNGVNSSNENCGPYTDELRFMSSAKDFDKPLQCATRPGTAGDGDEKPMAAMLAALSPELATSECNGTFSREDALLVVTVITDEEDDDLGSGPDTAGSGGDPKTWRESLIKLKGGDESNIVVLGLIGTKDSKNCRPLVGPDENLQMEGAQISERLESFVNSFRARGLVGDVCAPSYEGFFQDALETVELALDS